MLKVIISEPIPELPLAERTAEGEALMALITVDMTAELGPYCRCSTSASSHCFCSTCGPTQWSPPRLGAGLEQVRVRRR